jgi:hypothetical protein
VPESTLALAKADIDSEVGAYLGYGRGSDGGDTAWSTAQRANIDLCVKGGLRSFYFNAAVPELGVPAAYNWSFLKPTYSLAVASGGTELDLPADFGGLDGSYFTLLDSGRPVCRIPLVPEGVVRLNYAAEPDRTGPPLAAAVVPVKGTQAGRGQRFRLSLWPAADAAYTLQFTYYLLPDALRGDAPYAYGGAQHAETILAACKAAAERDLDDLADGPQQKYFRERLAASVMLDRRGKPQYLGYNADRSDGREWGEDRRRGWNGAVATWAGVEPD